MKRAIISLVTAAAMIASPIAAFAEEGTTSATEQAPLAAGDQCQDQDRDDNGHCIGVPLIVWLGAGLVAGGIACAAGGCTSGGGGGNTTQTTGTP